MRFIESILFKDGSYHNLKLHQERMNRTFHQFMPEVQSHDLEKILPKLALSGTYKLRLLYDGDQEEADYDLEFIEYAPRTIQSLQPVISNAFDYSFKYENRSEINELVAQSKADDIIILIDGNVTDGSYFNLVFWDGKDWFTPESHLLNGVRRQQLLQEGRIKEAPISIDDIGGFKKVSLINAMLDLGVVEVTMDQVLER